MADFLPLKRISLIFLAKHIHLSEGWRDWNIFIWSLSSFICWTVRASQPASQASQGWAGKRAGPGGPPASQPAQPGLSLSLTVIPNYWDPTHGSLKHNLTLAPSNAPATARYVNMFQPDYDHFKFEQSFTIIYTSFPPSLLFSFQRKTFPTLEFPFSQGFS